jgi:TolB-like protein/Flp pilus assembly protein TadD
VTDIFLSYNREDQARAKVFAEAFEAQGFKVWWDVGLRTGEAYDQVTEKALRDAKAVVVLWSKRSVESRWVRAEATLADRNKTLVPCMIEPCERPIMFELTQTAELSHWTGEASDRAWLAFLSDVKRLVSKGPALTADAPATPLAAPTVQETLKPGQSGSAPSLAVLPFTNRSHLPEDEVFAEGMVEDVISALSQGVNVRVLGSTATAMLNRAAFTDIAALGRQLGVRYLLEGNVRRVGANLRVTTQLLEAETGTAIWTAKFDRPLTELAELQEELVTDIAAGLDVEVYSQEMERALSKPGNMTAWEALARANSAYTQFDKDSVRKVITEATRAITIAPDYAPGHAMLATGLADAYIFNADDPVEVQRIRSIAERAVVLAPNDVSVLGWVAHALTHVGYAEEAVRYSERAIRKAPGGGMLHYYHGEACCRLHRMEEALSHLSLAERLLRGWNRMWAVKLMQSHAFHGLGRSVEAESAIDESISLLPSSAFFHVFKAVCSMRLGRTAEARRHIEIAQQLGSDFSMAERTMRRAGPRSPTLEADIALIRQLYAAAEFGT